MATDRKAALLCALLLGACGCVETHGLLYTQTTAPYKMPYETVGRTAAKSCSVDITRIEEPVSGFGLNVMWTDRVVAEAMRKAGMAEVRYADVQTLSVVFGVYSRRRLVLYGE